jgi:hypothetical protein
MSSRTWVVSAARRARLTRALGGEWHLSGRNKNERAPMAVFTDSFIVRLTRIMALRRFKGIV